jgi:hypothetical protein
VVGAVATFVLLVWYPAPLPRLQGVPAILGLLALVDVVVGPMLTLVIASAKKDRRQLTRDLAVIGTVQLAALIYGVHSVFVARPVFIVFNVDRFDAVLANDLVRGDRFPYRTKEFEQTSVLGPRWTITYPPDSLDERNKLLMETVRGGPDIKDFPALFEPWPPKREQVREHVLKPIADLNEISEKGVDVVRVAVQKSGLAEDELRYVPLVGRERIGIVILNSKTWEVVLASDVTPVY